jgi:hypothetical protein
MSAQLLANLTRRLQTPEPVQPLQEAARPLTLSTPEEEAYALRRMGRVPSLQEAIAVLQTNYPGAEPK